MPSGCPGRALTRPWALALALALLAACDGGRQDAASPAPTGPAEPAGPGAVPSLEVREPVVWVCRPGQHADRCERDLDAVAVTASGTAAAPFVPAAEPPVDCFYVYPTVSGAAGPNAPKQVEPAVVATVRAQAARFGEVCRVFAPVYRQVTVTALSSGRFFDPAVQQVAYDDVRDAWRSYLDEDNGGRGVVLVGHSQGAMMLARLLSDDVAREPAVRDLVVSALLVGGQLTTAAGSEVVDRAGGLPACREPGQVRCVVAYSAFTAAPPADAFFGRTVKGREVVCTDPTRLSGGDGTLHPYVPTDRLVPSGLPAPDGAAAFVTYPGAAAAECRQEDGAGWLHVSVTPGAPVPDVALRPDDRWGLHALDVTLALGDLVEIVRRQAAAWPAG